MTYETREISTHGGAPVEYYEFVRGATRWTYTSAQANELFRSSVFEALPITRSDLETSSELGRASIKVTFPRDSEFVSEYLISPPSEVTTVTVYAKHQGDSESDAVVIWMGRLINLNWGKATVVLDCEPVYTSIRRLGLRRQYSRGCSHVLYGPKCRLSATDFRATGSAVSIASNSVGATSADTFGDHYYSGGYLEYDYDGRVERKMILRQTGIIVVLASIPFGLTGGMTVRLFPGCDHTLATCRTKFLNWLNYGGFPWIPTKNPFAQIALW